MDAKVEAARSSGSAAADADADKAYRAKLLSTAAAPRFWVQPVQQPASVFMTQRVALVELLLEHIETAAITSDASAVAAASAAAVAEAAAGEAAAAKSAAEQAAADQAAAEQAAAAAEVAAAEVLASEKAAAAELASADAQVDVAAAEGTEPPALEECTGAMGCGLTLV